MNEDEPQLLECRALVEISPPLVSKLSADATTTNEILFLPIGLHAITPVSGGIGRPIKVKIDNNAASAIQKQHEVLMASGKRPYFDFNHEDGPASFWPESFAWRAGEGVVAKGEWSARGRNAVEGKDFRAFSPVFHVDNKRSDPATVVCKDTADPNMGGLVNNPAFDNLPLWAKNAEQLGSPPEPPAITSAPAESKKETDEMTAEEIAALRAKFEELTTRVDGLNAIVAKNTEDEKANLMLTAAQAELKRTELEIENAELQGKANTAQETIRKRNLADADTAIKAAIQRGAILPKDFQSQEKWRAQLAADPG